MHTSVKLNSPVEFINITPLNPLISKCQIKVCYVSDKPNRNRSVITKEVAKKMANSLPGCPIVGFFNEDKGDFEEHNRIIDISNGEFKIKDTTRPYGFVDLGAKVWFQKFLDDNKDEREYMMTEGWLWTGQYPECQRIIDEGNNHSMELYDKMLDAEWTKNENGKPQFFIINEAIISKLCTLGVENEPCFEGSHITAPIIQFAFEDGFKEQLVSMMSELKDLLNKGGEKVFTRYSVEVGDALWDALYSHVEGTYGIESVCEEGEQKFAVLTADEKYYRLDFSVNEEGVVEFAAEAVALEDYTPAEEPQFSADAVAEYASKKKKKKDDEEEKEKNDKEKESDDSDSKKKPPFEKKKEDDSDDSDDDDEDEEKKKKKKDKKSKYNLEEVQEYVELSAQYSALETNYANAQAKISDLEAQINELTEFKKSIEKKDKEAMIAKFYMLSDKDKEDVIANIDTYSLDDIEAKLSIICVRNKVSFNLDDDKHEDKDPTTYNLGGEGNDDGVPAWIKAMRAVASEMN